MSCPNTNAEAGAAAVHESRSPYAAAPDDASCRTKNGTAAEAVPSDASRRMKNATVAGAVPSGASRRMKNGTAEAVPSDASRRTKNGMTNGTAARRDGRTADANRRSPTKNAEQDATNASCPDDLSAALRGLLSDVISRRNAFCGHRTARCPRLPSWRRAPPD